MLPAATLVRLAFGIVIPKASQMQIPVRKNLGQPALIYGGSSVVFSKVFSVLPCLYLHVIYWLLAVRAFATLTVSSQLREILSYLLC